DAQKSESGEDSPHSKSKRRGRAMRISRAWLLGLALLLAHDAAARAACCYFSAKNADILQPAQKVFVTWEPQQQMESFTVQPKFEGNALDFGMVIPTPTQPKLHEMPREFFKHLAYYTILKTRELAHSKLFPHRQYGGPGRSGGAKAGKAKDSAERETAQT